MHRYIQSWPGYFFVSSLGCEQCSLGWLRSWYVLFEARWQVRVTPSSDTQICSWAWQDGEPCSVLSAGTEPWESGCDFPAQTGLCIRAEHGPPIIDLMAVLCRFLSLHSCPVLIAAVISGLLSSPAHSGHGSHLFPTTLTVTHPHGDLMKPGKDSGSRPLFWWTPSWLDLGPLGFPQLIHVLVFLLTMGCTGSGRLELAH